MATNDNRPPPPEARPGPVPGPAQASGHTPGPAGGRRRRAIAIWSAVLVLALATPVVALWALLRSEAGTGWLLARVPGLEVEGLDGALLADRLALQRLAWQGAAGRLEIDALELRQPRWRLWPAPGQWLALDAERLQADRVQWRGTATAAGAPPSPSPLPESLGLPVRLTLPLAVGTLVVDDLAPVQGLALTLRLGTDGGATHAVDGLALRWQALRVSDGRLRLGAQAPLPLALSMQLASTDGAALPWQAELRADGTPRRIALTATLRGPVGAAADAQAALEPFAAWPLASLALQTEALDLSVLHPAAPRTRLGGRAALQRTGPDAPLEVTVDLRNAAPGRWDDQRLPLSRVEATLRGRPDVPDRVEIPRLALQLADATGAAGRVDAEGAWQGHTLSLDMRLDEVAPHRLDRRASAMTLAGPLSFELAGLPSPDPAATGDRPPLALDLRATLDGRLSGLPQAVRLVLQAQATPDSITLERLQASAGGASARLTGSARRASGRWDVQTEGALVDFDPLPWWPGAGGTAWQSGPHRLSGQWRVDAGLPESTLGGPWPAALAQWRGSAELQIERSLLAGVALDGDLRLALAAGQRAAEVDARLALGGNRVDVAGRIAPAGDGRDDRWQLELDAPVLAALAPLAGLHPATAQWAPRAGTLAVSARATGRWPDLATEGQARARGVRSGLLSVAEADLDWRLDPLWPGLPATPQTAARPGATPPWGLRATVRDLRHGEPGQVRALTRLVATLDGSPASHRLSVDAAAPLVPPEALTRGLGLPPAAGTRLALQVEGGWLAEPDGAGFAWRGRIDRLNVGDASDPAPAATTGEAPGASVASVESIESVASDAAGAPWLTLADLGLGLRLAADGRLLSARTDPGRADLAGGLRLRLDEAAYEAPTATRGERLQFVAELEPVTVAPFLARAQPDMGWAGDLRAGARIVWRVDDGVSADVVIERQGGDLQVIDIADQPLALGLSDLRLALAARDGEWLFTQSLAGRTLGELGGVVRLRTDRSARLPGPDAPLDGAVQARVADLGVWGAWLPPGWRLQGTLQTSASFGGRLGAPQVEGTLDGSGLGVRNLLQGVHVRDGDVRLRLAGERATVERFVLKAGDGELRITGGATLGADPQVDLALQADRFQVLGRIDRRLIASGNATLALDRERLRLLGDLGVDEGLFDISRADAPTLDADVVVRRPGTPPPAPPAPAGAPGRLIEVDLRIALGERLRLRGRGLDTRLAGDLRFSLPDGRPTLVGQLRTVGGTYAAYAQKLAIERGLISFTGPPDTPRLDILALRPGLDVTVGVAITGPASAPRVRLYSDPDMGDSEKLSWLVLGRDPGTVDRADTALLQRAALALLAGEEPSPADELIRRFGIDEFSVRQGDEAEGETIVSLGKQISDRWYLGYERSVNAATGTWQLIYRAAKRFTLRLQSGVDNSVDAIWVWRVE
jgi:translocation and assembly module TamB